MFNTCRKVNMFDIMVTSEQYPDVFALPRYKRLPAVIDMIKDQLDITVDNGLIIKEVVSVNTVILKFYIEDIDDE